jgi:hypothetical protein
MNEQIDHRKNQTHQWCPADKQETYKPIQQNGAVNYTINEVSYTFNGDGFRCDDFSLHSDFPILFMGCSFTEGIGLPTTEIWPTYILNKIKSLPQFIGKRIPFWSIALGGSGIDTQSRMYARVASRVKPKYAFLFLIDFYRREFAFDEYHQYWTPNSSGGIHSVVNKLFTNDSYALYQVERSLLILELQAAAYNTLIYIFSPEIGNPTLDISSLFANKPHLKLITTTTPEIFSDQQDDAPLEIISRPPHARDDMHPGALRQYNLSKSIWGIIKHEFEAK